MRDANYALDSYQNEYGPVANADAATRAAFIRRTYLHLAGAVLAFVGLEALLLNTPGIFENVIGPMLSSRLSWFVVLALFIGGGYLARYWARHATSPGMQYAGLGLYVVLEAIIFLPLLYIADTIAPATGEELGVIPTAGILTLLTFAGLTAAVFISGKDFSFMGTAITVASFIALGVIGIALITGMSLGIWFAVAMIGLASAAIIYNTSNIMHNYYQNQHVAAALDLFGAVALLFYYVVYALLLSRDE